MIKSGVLSQTQPLSAILHGVAAILEPLEPDHGGVDKTQTSETISPFTPLPDASDEKENIAPVEYNPRKKNSHEDKDVILTPLTIDLENKSDEEKDATWTPDEETDSGEEMTDGPGPNGDTSEKKPPYTYRQMIAQALLSKESKQMSDDDICEYVRATFFETRPFSKNMEENVQKGLELHFTSFIRVPSTLPGKIWTLHPVCEVKLMKTAVKNINGGWKIQFTKRTRAKTKEKQLNATATANSLPAKFKCRLCGCLVDSLTSMKQHIIEIHGNQQALRPKMHQDNAVKQRMFGKLTTTDILSETDVKSLCEIVRLCPTCNVFLSERGRAILKHLNGHARSNKVQNYICGDCGQEFDSRKLYGEHRKRNHQKVRVFQCKHCQQFWPTPQSLRDHVSRAHSVEKNYQCQICGKSFRALNTLNCHMPVHMAIKPFQCPECGKGFAKKTNLDSHRRVHSGEKPYKCDLCTQAYTHNVSLKLHKKKVHGIDMWAL